MTNPVVLRDITKCTHVQVSAVREIRNQESVRRSMYTDHLISIEEHLGWIDRLKLDDRQIVFVVSVDDIVCGVVSVSAIDQLHRKSDWAFYLDEKVRGGLGAALEFALIEFVFNKLDLEKLNCEVIETNHAVVKMHRKFAFVEEGFRRDNICRNGKRIGVYFLGLTKNDWLKERETILDKYGATLNRHSINIEYE